MRKAVALTAVALTAATFLVSAAIALPRDPADITPGLMATMIASAVAFIGAVVIAVLVAWPKQGKGHEAR